MKLVSAKIMRELDRSAIEDFKIPGGILMENAGAGCARLIGEHFADEIDQGVMIICGTGNNGGDGFVIARHLWNSGCDVDVIILGSAKEIKGDAKINYEIAKAMDLPIFEVNDDDDFDEAFFNETYGLIVDAIFGTGLDREVTGIHADVIEIINGSDSSVFAVDIPSGLNSDTGLEMGTAIYADMTATFGLSKIGQWLYPGRIFCGSLKIVDISIPPLAIEKADINYQLVDRQTLIHMFLPRNPNAHKGNFGHALIIGGSQGLTGAAAMAGDSALRTGAGLVTIGAPTGLNEILEIKLNEVMTKPFGRPDSLFLGADSAKEILEAAKDKDVVAIGPGLGKNDETKKLIYEILPQLDVPVVIDADGLNLIADDLTILKKIKKDVILTPHPGEMSRMTGKPVNEILNDIIGTACIFAKEHSVYLVLKGGCTVTASPHGEIFLNPTGNPGMATGGAGDVLTGIIAGLLSQGWSALESAVAGVYLHGAAGDFALCNYGQRALTAGDIIESLPEVIGEIEERILDSNQLEKDFD